MKPRTTDSLQWPEALVEMSNLWLAYQPIFSIKANEQSVIAFESLLRVDIGGVANGPAEIVAAAESDGSIVLLDRWVLHEVIRLAVTRPRLNVWVNASQISIGHHTFLDEAIHALTSSQTISRIRFEITETADINAALLARRLDTLKVRALTVMIDDIRVLPFTPKFDAFLSKTAHFLCSFTPATSKRASCERSKWTGTRVNQIDALADGSGIR